MGAEDTDRAARAGARATRIVLKKTRLGAPDDDVPMVGEAAVSLATALSREAWSLSGRPMPPNDRGSLSFRFVART